MLHLIALLLTLIGATLIYITSKHQRVIQKPTTKLFALFGAGFLLLALLCWLVVFNTTVAIFIWTFTGITMLTLVPLLTLLFRRGGQ